MLVQIGALWEKGQLSVQEEGRFTRFSESILEVIQKNLPDREESPIILLVTAEKNFHTFGLKMLHLLLIEEGISSKLIVPGVSLGELIEYTKKEKPSFVGISISDQSQMANIKEYLKLIRAEMQSDQPQVLLGGFPIKTGQISHDEIAPAIALNDLQKLIKLLKAKKNTTSSAALVL
jgi:methanogenic corrinoid protein MtbC1